MGTYWLADQLAEAAGSVCQYSRVGWASSIDLSCVVRRQAYDVIDAGTGLKQSIFSRDYIFKTAELIYEGEPFTPREGDKIEDETGTNQATPLDKRPCVEPHDTGGVQVVVHTKRIKQ